MRQFTKYVVWLVTGVMLVLIYIGTAIIDVPMFVRSYLPLLILFGILTWLVISNQKNGVLFLCYSHIVIVVPIIITLFALFGGLGRDAIKLIADTMYEIDFSNGLDQTIEYLIRYITPFLLAISAVSWYLFKFSNRQDKTSVFLLVIITVLCIHTLFFFLPYRTTLKNYLDTHKKRVQAVDKGEFANKIEEITNIMSYIDTVSIVSKELKDSLENKFNELPYQNTYRSGEIPLPNQIKNDLRSLEKLYKEKHELTSELRYRQEEIEMLGTVYANLRPPVKCGHFKHLRHKRKNLKKQKGSLYK